MRRTTFVMATGFLLATTTAATAQDWVSSVFPDRAYDFGTVARGSKLRHAFRLVNNTGQEIHIAEWRPKCGCTDVRVGARQIPTGTQTVVEATLDTTRFQGYKASGLTLVLDRPSLFEVDLNLTCFIRGDVFLNPGQIDFGVVARKSKPTLTLMLTYAGGQPGWAVTKMQTISAFVSAQLRDLGASPTGQTQYQITATLDPRIPNGYFKDEVTLITNDPASPKIPISVTANVQSQVSLSPSIMNLGQIRAGQTVKKTVLLRSAQPFRITEIKGKSDSLTGAVNGAEGSRPLQTVTVTFKAPARPGPFNTILEIGTDLDDEPPAKLTTFATILP